MYRVLYEKLWSFKGSCTSEMFMNVRCQRPHIDFLHSIIPHALAQILVRFLKDIFLTSEIPAIDLFNGLLEANLFFFYFKNKLSGEVCNQQYNVHVYHNLYQHLAKFIKSKQIIHLVADNPCHTNPYQIVWNTYKVLSQCCSTSQSVPINVFVFSICEKSDKNS